MARKVFISVLGTGFYGKCVYYKGDFKSSETRFIQQATLEMLTSQGDWGADDRGYILLTEKARTVNWHVNGNVRQNYLEKKEEVYIGLEDELQYPFSIETLSIPDGKDEKEIWEIFNIVFSVLQNEDELYFDLTHGFRYLPMLLLVLGNYAKFLKGVRVKSVTYGNYEARVDGMAPFVDVTSFSLLQDWTFSGASFTEMGKVHNFTESLKGTSPAGKSASIMKLNNCLNTFEDQISTCRGKEIMEGKEISEAQSLIRKTSKDKGIPQPLLEILERVNTRIAGFSRDSFDNLAYAIKWCERYGMFQQGYTLCQESIVTLLCQRFADLNPCEGKGKTEKERIKSRERAYRDYWTALLGLEDKKINDVSSWTGELAKSKQLTSAWMQQGWLRDFRKKFSKLQERRNQLNHAGFTGKMNSGAIRSSFAECVSDCLSLFHQDLSRPDVRKPAGRLFINLTNHPSSTWDDRQRAAALELGGEIVDIPFPQVSPGATVEDIDSMARQMRGEIDTLAQDKTVIVHVMGEMGLTYRLVRLLSGRGIRCVCSTSYRHVRDEADGKRIVEFHFEQFRDYE